MKAEIIQEWECPQCEKWHDDPSGASECCEDDIQDRYRCSVCDEVFQGYKDWEHAQKHLETPHVATVDVPTASETYLEALRFGKPPLGEWVVTMEAETEFLIPNK